MVVSLWMIGESAIVACCNRSYRGFVACTRASVALYEAFVDFLVYWYVESLIW
jgi:hypothetical protein